MSRVKSMASASPEKHKLAQLFAEFSHFTLKQYSAHNLTLQKQSAKTSTDTQQINESKGGDHDDESVQPSAITSTGLVSIFAECISSRWQGEISEDDLHAFLEFVENSYTSSAFPSNKFLMIYNYHRKAVQSSEAERMRDDAVIIAMLRIASKVNNIVWFAQEASGSKGPNLEREMSAISTNILYENFKERFSDVKNPLVKILLNNHSFPKTRCKVVANGDDLLPLADLSSPLSRNVLGSVFLHLSLWGGRHHQELKLVIVRLLVARVYIKFYTNVGEYFHNFIAYPKAGTG
uniref:Uncharacterized protein n=2 Tax=Guillardia theta TaxID=55529 RepID=A0A7S4PL35_GUITH|mmetsp:Transcript_58/g.137  ORF Transcript_58/g.137 Transcript_58/m.137 type:complete len:292 (+) Transcript_58:583-1458(+)